ncbi:uncharacterized protein LOC128670478 [Plodia interpunctella]|uniref:uncharacterized protein LOC128670478 n=1 Tax=Plodia interpunctella TaxID=58824 RepID=UPI002367B709|nr:uncharacterized protein LOC128670478 isoform X2 [Plodia interpunctella]
MLSSVITLHHDFPPQSSKTTPSYKTQVHSHGQLKVIEYGDMKRTHLCGVLLIALLAILSSTCSGYHLETSYDATSSNVDSSIDDLSRQKRQIENFDTDDYPTTPNQDVQEETSFWDRVVKVALQLFSRFVEWLNS